ncbi:MAG: redoxin domain-containing protein [Candidatus Heimdallarchaeaceae archaeon]
MQVGNKIPNFTLKDQDGEDYNIEEVKDKYILLSFHPLAFTDVCAKQMKDLEKHTAEFEKLGIEAVGISVDSVPAKKAWAKELGIKQTRLLSDFHPHGKVAKQLELFLEDKGFSQRANIIIGKNKEILFMKVYQLSTLPNLDEITKFIRKEKERGREL